MNKIIIITGVSSGIGRAFVEHYLAVGEKVVGLGRKNDIQHENYTFFSCDFSQPLGFQFLKPLIENSQEILLINNAGVIGNVERISEQNTSDIQEVMQVNAIAPMLLCQFVLKHFPIQLPLTIINISSGAGKNPLPACASYCASKAALDLFSRTIYLEEIERNRAIKVYSVAPGVVDTPMQLKMRSSNEKNFSSVSKFKTYHAQNELYSSAMVVQKMMVLLAKKYTGEIIYSLRDISI
jgi:benzil reductase ((S)-benzoin forming)